MNRISDEDLDFTLLELDSNQETPIGLAFLDSGAVTDVPPVGHVVTILGHPVQLSESLTGGMAIHRILTYEQVEEVGRFSGHQPETHFQLSFTFGQQDTEGGFKASGLSGAGVWFSEPKIPVSGLWTPSPHLIGIVTHAIHTAPFALAGTRIKKIMEALAAKSPTAM